MPREVRVGGQCFIVRLWPTVLTIRMLAVLVTLGTWQVQRLHWKENLIATVNERVHLAPVPLGGALKQSDAAYVPAIASGLFQHDREFYLSAISLKGEGGFHVLTPLQLDDGRFLLVDRGWVPYDRRAPATRLDGQVIGPVAVSGILVSPQPATWVQPANDVAGNNWYHVDLSAMARQANIPAFLPYVLQADARPNAGGYPVGGQTRVTFPNNHLSYAVTWYGLALTLVVIYLLQARRAPAPKKSENS